MASSHSLIGKHDVWQFEAARAQKHISSTGRRRGEPADHQAVVED